MNLVVGSTGLLGGEICRRLATSGKPIRALVRKTSDPEKVENLRRLGAEIVYGDLKDRPSIDAACQGASAVISTATTTLSRQSGDTIASVDRQGQLDLVDAATEAGVAHFVYVSFDTAAFSGTELTAAKQAVEDQIKKQGLTHTILRPNVCVDTWLAPALGFDYVNGKVIVYGSGENRISFVTFGDVARFAVHSLTHPALVNTSLYIGGPEALSWNEVVRIFEEVSGRHFEVIRIPEEALRGQLEAAKRNPSASDLDVLFPQFGLSMAREMIFDPGEPLKIDPTPLTSVRDVATRVIRATANDQAHPAAA